MRKRNLLLIAAVCAAGFPPSAFAEKPGKITPDVVYGHKDGLAMTFDVIAPREPNGAGVLFMVSGGWNSRWFPPQGLIREAPAEKNGFEALLNKGFTLFLVRHGSAPRYKVPDAVADVRLAVRHVRLHAKEFAVDPARLGAYGGSAGGHLSLILGTTGDDGEAGKPGTLEGTSNRVAAVVAYYPPTNITDILPLADRFPALQFDKSLVDGVSPLKHVSPDDAPTLLVHGDKDELVPLDHSERIDKAFEEHKVPHRLLVIEGAAHGFRGEDDRKAIAATVEWFEKHLAKKAEGETPKSE